MGYVISSCRDDVGRDGHPSLGLSKNIKTLKDNVTEIIGLTSVCFPFLLVALILTFEFTRLIRLLKSLPFGHYFYMALEFLDMEFS